jgi:glycosyltransferase involved in cell wall biosynthesis
MRSVSVVVRSFNEEAHIGRLLTGITRQRVTPDEIIVVDSGSTDATVAIASAFPVKVLTISPHRFSFGRSLNVGCGAASSDVLVFASSHVYPLYDSWLEHLIAPFDEPDVALAYGRQVGDEQTSYSENQILAAWFPPESARRQDHPFCNNANAAVRRTVWEELPYDEALTGLEDVDWGKRALERGHAISYVAEAPIVHVHTESFTQIVTRYRREAIAYRRVFDEQRLGRLEALRLAGANVLSDYYQAARDRVLIENALSIPRFRCAQFWGTYQGFAQQGPVSSALKRRFYYPRDLEPGMPPEGPAGKLIDYDAQEETGDLKVP